MVQTETDYIGRAARWQLRAPRSFRPELFLAKEKMCDCGVEEGFSLVGVEPRPGPDRN